MYEPLKRILAEIVGCAPEEIPDDAELTRLEGWDSLRHLELVLALEAEFDIHIQTKEIRELASLEQINDYVHVRSPVARLKDADRVRIAESMLSADEAEDKERR